MPQTLVIVDSNSKYEILKKYLKGNYFIYPEIDIINNLLKIKFAYTSDGDFTPHFLINPDHQENITHLNEFSLDFQNVIIGANPDLRGELLVKLFEYIFTKKNGFVKRVIINEFTRVGIKQAFDNPVLVNNLLINSYVARLAIDRLIKKNNNILKKSLSNDLRLEHIMALRFICEREDAIEKFKTNKSFVITVELKVTDNQSILCQLINVTGHKPIIPDIYHAKALILDLKKQLFKVKKITQQQKKITPPAPFMTTILLHEAYKNFKYPLSKTLNITKELYEGIDLGKAGLKGLITFYHTQSNYTHPDVVLKTRELIYANYGAEYLPPKQYNYNKNNTLVGAIRPVDVKLAPQKVRKYLTDAQFNIYSLIWNRFIASQMSLSTEEQTTVDIISDAENRYELKSLETKVLFRGYKLLDNDSKQYNITNLNTISKELRKNQILQFKAVQVEKQVSAPVNRYNETSLLHELVSSGRDYFPDLLQTTGTLFANKLIKYHKEQILPTPTGYHLCHFAFQHFPNIYNPGFIAKIAHEIESIEKGKKKLSTVIENFTKLQQHVILNNPTETNTVNQENHTTSSGKCPVCNSSLILTALQTGQFRVCKNFPEKCRYTEPVSPSNINTSITENCAECGSSMVVREGRFGRFLACSKYPKCSYTKAYPIDVRCPQEGCNGEIVEKKTRDGKLFYGCSHYPKCKFASWHKPDNILCENCGNLYLVIKTDDFEKYYQCQKCNSKYDLNVIPIKNNVNIEK